MSVQASKIILLESTSPPPGISASKIILLESTSPPPGISVSKMVLYEVYSFANPSPIPARIDTKGVPFHNLPFCVERAKIIS